jgi:hypothetical protein
MEPFLGFIVLTSPLFLIVLWVPVCLVLAIWVSKKLINRALLLKIVGGFAVFFVALVLPVADEIAGRVYFYHLCETEAGAKVYQTIELPAECWDEQGRPLFYEGAINNDIPSNAFEKVKVDVIVNSKKVGRLFRIQQIGVTFTDKESGNVLSELTWFMYWGGWLARNFTPHNSAISCGGAESYDDLVKKQFIPMDTTGGG